MANIDNATIERFLGGKDPQQYITAIEVPYYSNEASLIINHPEHGKKIEKHKFRPFVWIKHDISGIIYGGNRLLLKRAMTEYGVKFKSLTTEDETGFSPRRMANGYRYIASTNQSYSKLLEFFENGGIKVYNDPNYSRMFQAFSPTEQFMIQTGKRLFKGMEDYDDIHRFQFDLETKGLVAETGEIFQIGMRDNKNWSRILTTEGETLQERRDSERLNIQEFFKEIIRRRPDTISGYNSEFFDWDYLERRCERLGIPMVDLAISLNGKDKIKRRPSTLKLGASSEHYVQTYLWGFNVMDISHPVRRAMEINSNIKGWSLKYITKFSKVEKKNRVYVPGKDIYNTWADKETDYWFCDEDGSWGKIKDDTKLEHNMDIVTGAYIVERYLLDDLWETDKVDTIYNQAAFLLSKILPTSYMRSSTMGTAGQWTLLLAAWSYENNLAIPEYGERADFTGGLSRLIETGYATRVVKLDFAALYPKTTLTWDIFPDLDISHVMKGLLAYIVSTRDKYKFLTGKYGKDVGELKEALKEFEVGSVEYEELSAQITKVSKLESDADKKQLPLKILANSFFGSYGAPNIFPWGDTPSAERITCMSRQHLRLMVSFFSERGFRPLVGDTDGFNFAVPDEVDDYKYTPTCEHWKTEDYKGQGELKGVEAVVAEFNETHMIGWMGLDVDDICEATINFKRKNYANLINGKVKLVGNSIKSKKMPTYIEEFLNVGIPLLLKGDGYSFIQEYYKEVDKIYNYEIPIVKIASKGKVNETLESYNTDCKTKTKAGNFKARKAHMELVKAHNLTPNMGDVIYYVNTGESKSKGDVTVATDKATGKRTVTLNCKYIPESMLESDPNLTTEEYNVPRYISALNKKVAPLLVCFDKEIRDGILIDTVKDRKLKEYVLKERNVFTKSQCTLVSNQPLDEGDQDSIEDFMRMEDKEVKFWDSVDEVPYLMDVTEWNILLKVYKDRMLQERRDAINAEKAEVHKVCSELELSDLAKIEKYGRLPKELLRVANVDVDEACLKSNEWDVKLEELGVIFDYKELAEIRDRFYTKSLLYLTRDRKKKPLQYWNMFMDVIRDPRFENEMTKPKVLNFWIDTSIEMGYDTFTELEPDAIYDLWVKCVGEPLSDEEIIAEGERIVQEYQTERMVSKGIMTEEEAQVHKGELSYDNNSLHSGNDLTKDVPMYDSEGEWGF